MNILDGLNNRQLQAVEHISGPCLVLAGAGAGKTKVLTTRIANLISNNIASNHILAITFTNKAAKEMKERLNYIISDNAAFVGTFHSLGLRIIKENFLALGLKRNFTIIDADDVLSVIKKIMKDLDYDVKEYSPSYIKNKISFIKNEMLLPNEIDKYLNDPLDRIAAQVYFEYQKYLGKNNTVDFDDLLELPVLLFLENPDILDKYQEKYQYILVDEYQDTNEVQYRLVSLLAKKYRNLFVVGDANQSIYAFRLANYKNILNFEKDYPDAKTIILNQNYRSTNTILNAANCVIKNNKERKDMELFSELGEGLKIKYLRAFDEKQEVNLILEEINRLLDEGYDYKDFAILYRTNGQARAFEDGMLKNNYPYKVVGSYYFYKRKEIKDLLCYLRLISNHADDVSLRRVINEPKRGIGAKSIDSLSTAAESLGVSMFDVLNKPKELEFKHIIEELTMDAKTCDLTELIDQVLIKTGIKKELENDKSLEAELRLENLQEFRSITENFQKETGSINLEDFLDEISIISDISEHKEYEDAITLMTIHSAKGLEFRCVFLAGMEENILPHSMSLQSPSDLEEERRLCYVAITRAKDRLYLTNAKKRLLFGNTTMNIPSRFIEEIDSSLIDIDDHTREFGERKFDKTNVYNSENTDFKHGDIVMHSTFGRGVVVATDERFVTVAFNQRIGVKKFLSNYQGLKKM